MEVTLHNVSIMSLREKVAAYRTLFDREPVLEVSGTFRDKAGELVFLSRAFYLVNDTARRYLSVCVDGEWTRLTPVDENIAQVKLS